MTTSSRESLRRTVTCVDNVPTVFNDEKKRIVARSNPERADRAAKRIKHVDQNHTTQHIKLPIFLHLIIVIMISLQLYFINL